MKQINTLLLLMISFYSFSQPVLQGSWPGISKDIIPFPIYLSKVGVKYAMYKNDSTIVLRNSNGSIYKTVLIPEDLSFIYAEEYINRNTFFISDNLFDLDDEIEYLASKPITYDSAIISIYNENGQVKYTFPDIKKVFDIFFAKNGSVFQAVITCNRYEVRVYNLPGTLPCNECGINGLSDGGFGSQGNELKAYPNPFNSSINIEYHLQDNNEGVYLTISSADGRELKRLPLQHQKDRLQINTADLPKGMLIATLYNGRGELISKRVVKIE